MNPASPSRLGLFTLFAHMSLVGFGGVMPWAHRMIVEQRRLMTQAEFAETLAYAQLLPGPTICNLSIIVGHRKSGTAGALAALAGMIVPPFGFILALGAAHALTADNPTIQGIMRGIAVIAAALVTAMAVKMGRGLARTWQAIGLACLMFTGIALLHWPLAAVMLGLAVVAVAIQPGPPAP